MQNIVDLDGGDGRALQAGQQNTPQRIAERQPEAPFQRLRNNRGFPIALIPRLHREVRLDQIFPVLLNHGNDLIVERAHHGPATS